LPGKSIRKNYILNISYQVLLPFFQLVTVPYVSRLFGAEGIGSVSYVNSIASYFSLLATMGISTFGQREISYVRQSKKERSIAFWEVWLLKATTSSIVLIAYFIFSLCQQDSVLYMILSLHVIAIFFDVTWFFQGLEEFGKIVFKNFLIKALYVAFVFTMLKSKDDLLIYAAGWASVTLLGNIILWLSVPKLISRVSFKELHPFKQRNMKLALSFFIPAVAVQVYTVLDRTMIGVITHEAAEIGYYEQAYKISSAILAFLTVLGTVTAPRMGNLFKNGKNEEIKAYMCQGYSFIQFLGIPFCLGLMLVSDSFVPWFFGRGFEKVVPLMKILAIMIPVMGISNVAGGWYLIPTGKENVYTRAVMAGAISNFFMNIILIIYFKAIGAAIASVIAECIVLIVEMSAVRKVIPLSKIASLGRNYYISGAVMTIVLLFVRKNLPANMKTTFFLVALGAGVYFLALFILRDEFLLMNIKTVLKQILGRLTKKGKE